MIPILIESDLREVDKSKDALIEEVRGSLALLVGAAEPIPEELVLELLRQKRILVILDHLSELSDRTRNAARFNQPDFAVNALVVTSRVEPEFSGTLLRPFRIEGNRLSAFIDAYLHKLGKRDLFDDTEYFAACRRLAVLVSNKGVTVLLIKLYVEQMIVRKEHPERGNIPDSIPDLFLNYLNTLNANRQPEDPDDYSVRQSAKTIAWDSLRQQYHPIAVREDLLRAALEKSGNPSEMLRYLTEKLQILRQTEGLLEFLQFSLDPVAEFLAALHLVEHNGSNEQAWQNLLQSVELNKEGARGFLLALHDCCIAKRTAYNLPASISLKLAVLAA